MRIYISQPKLEKVIIVSPTYLGCLTSEVILEHIDNVLHSAGEIPADEDLEINAGIVEFICGNLPYFVFKVLLVTYAGNYLKV